MFLYFFPSYLQVDLQLTTSQGCCGGSRHRNDSSCRISHTSVDEVVWLYNFLVLFIVKKRKSDLGNKGNLSHQVYKMWAGQASGKDPSSRTTMHQEKHQVFFCLLFLLQYRFPLKTGFFCSHEMVSSHLLGYIFADTCPVSDNSSFFSDWPTEYGTWLCLMGPT